jgi:quercetin dioxygenase-like cupin family protein
MSPLAEEWKMETPQPQSEDSIAVPAAIQPGRALPTVVAVFEQMQVTPYGDNLRRMVMEGVNRSGYEFELHLTELRPGEEPHPPHCHEHEEIVMMQKGTVDVNIEGETTRLTPGSVVYVASNRFHGWRNVGTSPSQYFIIALKPKF